jgi:hypothetical protein
MFENHFDSISPLVAVVKRLTTPYTALVAGECAIDALVAPDDEVIASGA